MLVLLFANGDWFNACCIVGDGLLVLPAVSSLSLHFDIVGSHHASQGVSVVCVLYGNSLLFKLLQGSDKVSAPGLLNFIPAVAYPFCLNLPAGFTQPGASTLANLCSGWAIYLWKRLCWHQIHLILSLSWDGTDVIITFSVSRWVTQ